MTAETAVATAPDLKQIEAALAAPFDPEEVKWKAQVVSGNRCLAVAFVDARLVAERLDEVLGIAGWQDHYEPLPDGSALCRLRLRLGGEWITKEDVGSPSEQPDEGDRRKASFSDALKRAAVKFGVARYLYRLPPQWCDYDPQKKRITGTPRLPGQSPPARPAAEPPPAAESFGTRLLSRLKAKGESLAREGLCGPDALLAAVAAEGRQRQLSAQVADWPQPACGWVSGYVTEFEAARRREREKHAAPAAAH